jgi:hypothetical protein
MPLPQVGQAVRYSLSVEEQRRFPPGTDHHVPAMVKAIRFSHNDGKSTTERNNLYAVKLDVFVPGFQMFTLDNVRQSINPVDGNWRKL